VFECTRSARDRFVIFFFFLFVSIRLGFQFDFSFQRQMQKEKKTTKVAEILQFWVAAGFDLPILSSPHLKQKN